MLVNGMYQVSVSSLSDEATSLGRVDLKDGIISGSDAGYDWKGTYEIQGNDISANFTAEPKVDVINIRGEVAPINLELSGNITNADTIELVAALKEDPNYKLSVSLFRVPV